MNITEELAKLEAMHSKGTLNDEEFRKAKEAVLGGSKGTSAPPAAQQQPLQKESAPKKSGFLDPKANVKALVRIIIILIVLGAGVWLLVSRLAGPKVATNLVKSVAHAPMTLHDSVESVQASSWKGIPLNLPYSGTLNVSVEVVSGNKMDVFLTDEANLEKYKGGSKNFRVLMQANKTQNFSQSARLPSGLYYLVLRDTTLGVLSSQSSDIKVVAKLE
jgi:hypothetical protein